MSGARPTQPVVLCIGGMEPTGAGDLLADAQVVASMGGHATGVVAAVKLHDGRGGTICTPLPANDLVAQTRAVLASTAVGAIKLGALGNRANLDAVVTVLRDCRDVPVVLHAGALCRSDTRDEELLDGIASLLCPRLTVLVTRSADARLLAPEADSGAAAAQQLMSYGCEYVLLSGTDDTAAPLVNRWYGHKQHIESFRWQRLPGRFCGAGSTLAAAAAALLAHGVDAFTAVHEAQQYTFEALCAATRSVHGRLLPQHMFWAQDDDTEHDA